MIYKQSLGILTALCAQLLAVFLSLVLPVPYTSMYNMEEELTAKRMGTVEEFSDLAAFLCSEQAAYISGQSISIDGGNSTNFY